MRGLFRALHQQGHELHFFERDVPYYASHRDAESLPYVHLHLYSDWGAVWPEAQQQIQHADVAVVTSYCPDGAQASELILSANVPRSIFYDMDTPVTLNRIDRGDQVEYIPQNGLSGFDLVLSYTGGEALRQLKEKLGARRVAPLYGWVDPAVHHRVPSSKGFEADLSYIGTFSADRQPALEAMLLSPALRLPNRSFLIAGAMYPDPASWPANVRHFEHVAPPDHAAFYSSSPITLNITRSSMAAMGFCPSGRLFEAAACGTAVLSDWWRGLDFFFTPGDEILVANSTTEAMRVLTQNRADWERLGARAQERALDCHTAAVRANRLLSLIEFPHDESSVVEEGALAGGEQ
jgi:spore maturation protein CgeB